MKQLGYITLLLLVLNSFNTTAQQELGLYFNSSILASNQLNPSFHPKRTTISFPSISFNYGNSAFAYNQLFKKVTDGRKLNAQEVIDHLKNDNILTTNVALDLFAINIKIENTYLQFEVIEKLNFNLVYPKELLQLGWNGNSQFIGSEINIAPSFNISAYRSYGLGIAYEIGDFTIGHKIKFLAGAAHASSENEQATMYINPEYYQTSLNADYLINTSGIDDFEIKQLSPLGGFDNPGYAIDLGVNYNYSKEWKFSASLIDLGTIYWRSDLKNYNVNGNIDFSGLEAIRYVDNDTFNFDDYTDSIVDRLVSSESSKKFKQQLVSKLYVSASRTINANSELGALIYAEFFRKIRPAFALNYLYKVNKDLSFGATWAMKNQRWTNLGFSYHHKINRTSIYLLSDNVFSTIFYKKGRNVNFRLGFAYTFTKKNGISMPKW